MVSPPPGRRRFSEVAAAVCGSYERLALRGFARRRRTSACTLSWTLLCALRAGGSAVGRASDERTCTRVLRAWRFQQRVAARRSFSARHTACVQPSKARGRTRGRLPWAFDEHLEDPSYSFRGFFLRPALALQDTSKASKRFICAAARVRRSSDTFSSVGTALISRLLQPAEKTARAAPKTP